MCDEAVHDFLAVLKLISDYFVTGKMIKKLFIALYADENILYFNKDFVDVIFDYNKTGTLNIDLNNISLGNNLMKIILVLLFLSDFWLGILNLENAKNKKKKKITEELMPIVWYLNRWWSFCVPQDKKKE